MTEKNEKIHQQTLERYKYFVYLRLNKNVNYKNYGS